MMVENKFDNNLIIRFLMNEASREEVKLLEEWVMLDSTNKHYFEQISDTWHAIELKKELNKEVIQSDLSSVLNRIDGKKQGHIHFLKRGKSNSKLWIIHIAAVFILGFALSWFVFYGQKTINSNDLAYNVIETPKGSNTSIILPDGSKIWLNAESTLRYPQNFSTNEREVFLEGEAFFEVAKDKTRLFLVNTSGLTIKVFGTRFNVKSYPEDDIVETTLVEGSISIVKTSSKGEVVGEEIKMEPNEQIVFYKKQENTIPNTIQPKKIENTPAKKMNLVLKKQIDTERFTSWKDGQLLIKSEPMIELAETLERRYNVQIHFEDEDIRQFRFTGTFQNETIEQVMEAIKLAASIDYKIEEGNIWIRKMKY